MITISLFSLCVFKIFQATIFHPLFPSRVNESLLSTLCSPSHLITFCSTVVFVVVRSLLLKWMNLHSLPVNRIIYFSSGNYCCGRSEIFQRVDSNAAQGERMSALKQKPNQTAHWSRVKMHKMFFITSRFLKSVGGPGRCHLDLALAVNHPRLTQSLCRLFLPSSCWIVTFRIPPRYVCRTVDGQKSCKFFHYGAAGWWDAAVPSITRSWATLANASRRLIFHKSIW